MRFISGLKVPMRSQVDIQNVMNFSKPTILATKFEAQIKKPLALFSQKKKKEKKYVSP